MRCTQLPSLQESLEFRYDSLLACINALNLIDKEYAFIAKPVLDDYFDSNNVKDLKEVVVVDLNDLHKELLTTEAMITVEKYKKNVKSLISTGPTELVELLNSEKCYTNAFKLAKGFKLDLTPIFVSLTLACIQIDESTGNDWLNRNVLTHINIGRDDINTAWNFLQNVLNEEVRTRPKYFKVVSRQILVNHAHLPLWLYKAYKVSSASEDCFDYTHLYPFFLSSKQICPNCCTCSYNMVAWMRHLTWPSTACNCSSQNAQQRVVPSVKTPTSH